MFLCVLIQKNIEYVTLNEERGKLIIMNNESLTLGIFSDEPPNKEPQRPQPATGAPPGSGRPRVFSNGHRSVLQQAA